MNAWGHKSSKLCARDVWRRHYAIFYISGGLPEQQLHLAEYHILRIIGFSRSLERRLQTPTGCFGLTESIFQVRLGS